MANRMAVLLGGVIMVSVAACSEEAGTPASPTALKSDFPAASGSQSTLLGRATFGDPRAPC